MTDQDLAFNSLILASIVKGILLRQARAAVDANAYLAEVSDCAREAVRQVGSEALTDLADARVDKIIGDVRALLS